MHALPACLWGVSLCVFVWGVAGRLCGSIISGMCSGRSCTCLSTSKHLWSAQVFSLFLHVCHVGLSGSFLLFCVMTFLHLFVFCPVFLVCASLLYGRRRQKQNACWLFGPIHSSVINCVLHLNSPFHLCMLVVLQVFLCSVSHSNSSWSSEWVGPSPSITFVLWTLSRGKSIKGNIKPE